MELEGKTNIQKHTSCLRTLNIHGQQCVNLLPPSQHQSIPKEMGMCFTALPQKEPSLAVSVSLKLSSTRGTEQQCHRLDTVPKTQGVWPFSQLLQHLQFLSWKFYSYRGTLIFPGKARTFFKSLPSAICGYFLSFHLDNCTLSLSLLFHLSHWELLDQVSLR